MVGTPPAGDDSVNLHETVCNPLAADGSVNLHETVCTPLAGDGSVDNHEMVGTSSPRTARSASTCLSSQ